MADASNNKKSFNLTLDFRWVSALLLIIIAAMLAFWQPWDTVSSTDRTVKVTGTAELKAEPDEFVFYPTYSFEIADKAAALKAVSTKNDEVVAGLKNVGVADKNIKNNSSSYETYMYHKEPDQTSYQLSLTITVDNKDLAQKVQDYLITTNPTGQVTPTSSFSEAKRRELEDRARITASEDARNKAVNSAKTLGYKLGKVKSVEDGGGFNGGPIPFEGGRGVSVDSAGETMAQAPLIVNPGQDTFMFSVTVTYYVR